MKPKPSQETASVESERLLRCQVEQDDAARHFTHLDRRRNRAPLKPSAFPDRQLPFLERVWLPYWLVVWRLEVRDGEAEVRFESLVCATEGTAFAIQAGQQSFSAVPATENATGEVFPGWKWELPAAIEVSRSLAQRFLGGGGRRIRASRLPEHPCANRSLALSDLGPNS